MTDPVNPFTLGAKIADVEYHGGIPHIKVAYVAKVTASGRFQIRYPPWEEGKVSDTVYQPELTYWNAVDGNVWQAKARGKTYDKISWRAYDGRVQKLEEKRARIQRTDRLLSEVQQRVSSMRATWENAEELTEKLAQALGIELAEEGKE